MSFATEVLSDGDFLAQFEAQTLDKVYFNHLGHLRLAWLYLQAHDTDTAVSQVCLGIQAYATSLGATDKFHMTITNAIVRIMAQRIDELTDKTWCAFLAENTDLVDDAQTVLAQYFSHSRLFSEEAQKTLLMPDRKPF